jgi:hypothetical protein
MIAAMLGSPLLVLFLKVNPILGYVGALLIPFVLVFLMRPIDRRFGIPCPSCGAQLALRKERFYDVVARGSCYKCGATVVDDAA